MSSGTKHEDEASHEKDLLSFESKNLSFFGDSNFPFTHERMTLTGSLNVFRTIQHTSNRTTTFLCRQCNNRGQLKIVDGEYKLGGSHNR